MNLLDLSVSLTVEENKAQQTVKNAVDAMIDEAERADKAFEDMAATMQNSFSKVAGEGFFSSFSDILGDEGKLLDFGGLIATGLSWVGLGIMSTAEGAKKAAEQYSKSVSDMVLFNGSIDAMAENLDGLKQRYSEFMELQEASGGYGFDFKALSEVYDAIDLQKLAMTETAVQNLITTYEEAQQQVSGWFAPFQEAEQIQSASLDVMAANIQSQIDYNKQYQQSLETLTDAGYGELAAQMQELGKSGAGYLQAFAEAVSEGDTEAINSIQTLMGELSTSQGNLANTITTTSGAFETLVKAMETATGEPYKIEVTDNALEVAENVKIALAGIPDEDVHVNVYTHNYTDSSTADSSNAQGLDYVPFDGFISSLHKGERILTAAENKEYTESRNQNNQPSYLPVRIEVPVEIDGLTFYRKTYYDFLQVANDHGPSFTGEEPWVWRK